MSICSCLAAISNATLPAAVTYMRPIIASYFSVYSRIGYSCINSVSVYGIAVTLENRFLSATQSPTLAFGYRRYGRRSSAIAGILVLDAGCIHVRLQWSGRFWRTLGVYTFY